MKAKITVRLKNGVLDPQGKAVLNAAHSMGFKGVQDVRVGKVFDVDLGNLSAQEAQGALEELSAKLLSNTVIENYEVELSD
ncbi:MAG: phosphoribosylformylglycinamidine synthase subunit PurS [bacterium]|nr:phosphoribosylformylglycinamidine synthase subunit PurS [bacterium]